MIKETKEIKEMLEYTKKSVYQVCDFNAVDVFAEKYKSYLNLNKFIKKA